MEQHQNVKSCYRLLGHWKFDTEYNKIASLGDGGDRTFISTITFITVKNLHAGNRLNRLQVIF